MRHLIDTTDISVAEVDQILNTALDIIDNRAKYSEACKGKKLATLFYEPSTRTRLSFTSAMMELGGNVLGFSDAASSSVSKGETVADTVRVIGCFADIIAMRHSKEGAPLVASHYSEVPIINAGDGSHAHPTQTLTDLLTIRREVCDKNNVPTREVSTMEEVMPELDILYMTRVQKERFLDEEEFERLKDSFILNPERLKAAKEDMIILHPLPRVNEITRDVDNDPRAAYFRQVENGKFVRMALIYNLLEWSKERPASKLTPRLGDELVRNDWRCSNRQCISNMEDVDKLFHPTADGHRCAYCEAKVK